MIQKPTITSAVSAAQLYAHYFKPSKRRLVHNRRERCSPVGPRTHIHLDDHFDRCLIFYEDTCTNGCCFLLFVCLFVLPAPVAAARAPACTCGSGCSFFSITLHGSHSLTHSRREELDGEGHPLKNRFCHFWANFSAGRRKQGRRPGSSVTPSKKKKRAFIFLWRCCSSPSGTERTGMWSVSHV